LHHALPSRKYKASRALESDWAQRWERAGNRLDIRWLRWLASAGGALATRRNLAGIRQFSSTVAGGWLPVKEPVAGTGLGIAGKRQVAAGKVANICPSHTQPGPS